MKKNITINLCGRLFQIDEDAYEMLRHYIESLRSSFGKQEGGDEIVDDIEARITELFDELRQNGTEAITIDHVKAIITRIGEPEQLTGEPEQPADEEAEQPEEPQGHKGWQGIWDNIRARTAGKRLYRNPDDKMVAGVLSGFAAYTNTDPIVWRVLTVLFTFFYGIGFVAYLVLAILLPEAKTPEQKLQMQGKKVTPQNLADVVIDKEQQAKPDWSVLRLLFSFVLKLAFGFFVGIAVIVCAALCIGFIFALVVLVLGLLPLFLNGAPVYLDWIGLADVYQHVPLVVVLLLFSVCLLVAIPAYAIIHMVLSLAGKVQSMSLTQRIVLIALWIVALCCLVPCAITMGTYEDEQYQREMDEKHTYQGVYMRRQDKHYLQQGGWRLIRHENCGDRYTHEGDYYTGDKNVRYLDTHNADCIEIYQAEHGEAREAGRYRLTCVARSQGRGAFIYARTAAGTKLLAEIPAYGNKGGEIYEQARLAWLADSLDTNPEADRLRQILYVHDGQGYGWSEVAIDDIVLESPDSVFYGVSTDQTFTGQPCTSRWFSVCDFQLTRVADERKTR